jgi:hypothetical protein
MYTQAAAESAVRGLMEKWKTAGPRQPQHGQTAGRSSSSSGGGEAKAESSNSSSIKKRQQYQQQKRAEAAAVWP